jgi:putative ABC transport system permease protein
MRRWLTRMAAPWQSARIHDEITEELEFHIERRTEENILAGMAPDAARIDALRRFGPRLQIEERGYDVRGARWCEALVADVRYGVRLLVKNKWFATVAAGTLALGVGANTVIFSLIYGIILRPLPYSRPEEIVVLHQRMPRVGVDDLLFSVQEVSDYRLQATSLSSLVEYHTDRFVLTDHGNSDSVRAGVVSHDFFEFFGVAPVLGRSFLPSDERAGAAPVAVLSHEYWVERRQRDPQIVGKTFAMDGRVLTVIGVLPPIPQYPDENDVYITTTSSAFRMWPERISSRNRRFLRVFARLRPGVALSQADDDLAVIAGRLQRQYPDAYLAGSGYVTDAQLLADAVTRQARPTIWLLLGAAIFMLATASANVANLTLARLTHREHELTLRAAIGASRSRLLRQLFTESALLGLLSAGAAFVFAVLATSLFVDFFAHLTPRAREVTLNGPVLVVGAFAAMLASIVAGSVHVLSSTDGSAGLQGGRSTSHARQGRVRSALIVAQVALSFTLLVGAGLMIRTLLNLQHVESGFSTERVLTMHLDFGDFRYRTPAEQRTAGRTILERLSQLPTVVSAADSTGFPLDPNAIDLGINYMTNRFRVDGETLQAGQALPWVPIRVVSAGYFNVLGIPLLQGRLFGAADTATAPPVVVVNRAFARHRVGANPIGKQLTKDGKAWLTIVGVVGDTKEYSLSETPSDQVYFPMEQAGVGGSSSWSVGSLLIRTNVAPMLLANQVRAIVHESAPDTAVSRIETLEDARQERLASPRVVARLMTFFGGVALIVAALGIGGIVALSVSQRAKEFGIRLALGAQPGALVASVVRPTMGLVVIGLGLGFVLAFVSVRPLQASLFQVGPGDAVTLAWVCPFLAGIALLACYVPARRVTRISPVLALRQD